MRHVFTFDASACTGCKACQVACKDRQSLPGGVLWRRVYEVAGGSWERRGAAWTNNVFAYNVSVGCNHCEDPACAAACPTDAYTVRDDGIVWLDGKKCVGCGYCAWVCPYGAPQYSSQLGYMTKCDGCRDLIDEGFAPSCVSACPMRALGFVEAEAQGGSEQPFPLPAASHRRPRLAIKPHRAMLTSQPRAVANYEEVRRTDSSDLPLIAFTLLGQAAAGAAILSLVTQPLSRALLAIIGVLIVASALVSLLHLGRASRAWRALANVKHSALSREILALAVFGAAWATALLAPGVGHVVLAAAGAGLVYSMADVYRVDAVPGWRAWRTRAAFATSTLLLGLLATVSIDALAVRPVPVWLVLSVAIVVTQQFWSRWRFYEARQQKAM